MHYKHNSRNRTEPC